MMVSQSLNLSEHKSESGGIIINPYLVQCVLNSTPLVLPHDVIYCLSSPFIICISGCRGGAPVVQRRAPNVGSSAKVIFYDAA